MRRIVIAAFSLSKSQLPIALSIIPILLMALIIQPAVIAQEGRLEWKQITSPALASNLIGDPATKPYVIYLPRN